MSTETPSSAPAPAQKGGGFRLLFIFFAFSILIPLLLAVVSRWLLDS